MFVCVCQGITDQQIRKAVQQGQGSLAQLKAQWGLSQQCGHCSKMAKQIINQELMKSAKYYEVA